MSDKENIPQKSINLLNEAKMFENSDSNKSDDKFRDFNGKDFSETNLMRY